MHRKIEKADDLRTALTFAAMRGDVESCKVLLEAGAPLNVDAMAYAAFASNEALFDVLHNGCSSHKRDQLLGWALREVIRFVPKGSFYRTRSTLKRSNSSAAVEFLIKRGAQVDHPGEYLNGETPLMTAAAMGRLGIVRKLHRLGANIDAVDDDRESALMRMARAGNARAVGLMLALGANPNIQNIDGETALAVARGEARNVLEAQRCGSLANRLGKTVGASPDVQMRRRM